MLDPQPQFARDNTRSLDGKWDFEAYFGGVKVVEGKINVPFCPESELSGINYKGFMDEATYRRTVVFDCVPAGRVFLHFGAADYEAHVYVNGRLAGMHIGGMTPFAFEITGLIRAGDNEIVVKINDDMHDNKPTGKQSAKVESYGCFYTRTTGIWQSVWLETVPEVYLHSVKYFPDPEDCSVETELIISGEAPVDIEVSYEGKKVGGATLNVKGKARTKIALSEKHLWEIGCGRLYDVKIKVGDDAVRSYFGLRDVCYDGMKFKLNGKTVFQRLVLDQGYYPDGIYTAPTDDAICRDIELSRALGFNGARLHQKIFDPRFLYHCDKVGYMVWGEYPNWGVRVYDMRAFGKFAGEWTEEIERDFNHPCIVTWCPLNEQWTSKFEGAYDYDKVNIMYPPDMRFVNAAAALTKRLDPTRPCVDASGGVHGEETDVYDIHNYGKPDRMRELCQSIEIQDDMGIVGPEVDSAGACLRYIAGLPINVSEYGGMSLVTDKNGWGYTCMTDENEFVKVYEELTDAIMSCKKVSGFCYTQLYDLEQEKNGMYRYDRSHKLSPAAEARIAACNRRQAEIEKE